MISALSDDKGPADGALPADDLVPSEGALLADYVGPADCALLGEDVSFTVTSKIKKKAAEHSFIGS